MYLQEFDFSFALILEKSEFFILSSKLKKKKKFILLFSFNWSIFRQNFSPHLWIKSDQFENFSFLSPMWFPPINNVSFYHFIAILFFIIVYSNLTNDSAWRKKIMNHKLRLKSALIKAGIIDSSDHRNHRQ